MSKKTLTIFVLVVLCMAFTVAAFAGCEDEVTPYKITYDSVGGSAVAATEGVVATEPVPVKEGYVFGGWYTDKECAGGRIIFPYSPAADVTLYAKWETEEEEETPPNFNIVTFESNGGTAVGQVIGVVEKEPVPTKKDCTFGGWYTSSSFTGNRVAFPYTPSKNTKLYAKWIVDFDVNVALSEIMQALRAQTKFDAGKAFGVSVSADIAGIGISLAMNVNPENASDIRVKLAVEKGGQNVVSLYADDVNMYAVSPDANKRFVNVDLAGIIGDAGFTSPDDMTYSVIRAALNMIFGGGEASHSGEVYTLQGKLDGIVSIIKLLGIEVPSEVTDLLSQLDVTAVADMKGGALNSLELQFGAAGINAGVCVTELKIANDYAPVTDVPAKDAAGFDETYALNFTLEGSVVLSDYDKGVYTDNYTMDYEIRVDYNIVSALRNSIKKDAEGNFVFDPVGLFSDNSNKIYINLSHKCAEGGCAFCNANREGTSRGSFLTLAYSPEDFGSNNVNLAINVKHLLPKGLLGQLVDLGGMDLISMFEEYIGLGIDPVALFINEGNYGGIAESLSMAPADGGISFEGWNPLGAVLDVFSFISEITQNGNSLRLSGNDLVQICDNFTYPAGFNIAQVLGMFFGDNDYVTINVDKAVYGDPETAKTDIYGEFMLIDESVLEYKKFTLNGTVNTPVKNIEWTTDKDGNVEISSDSVQNYKEDGSAYSLSADEVKALFETGSAHYTAYMMDGSVVESSAGIKAVYGIDYTLVDVPQEVLVVTTMTDAGSLSGLLSIVSGFLPDMDLDFAGNYFKTTITISSLKGEVAFYQADDVNADVKYDAEKIYVYEGKLNPEFTAEIEYANGDKKAVKVYPDNYKELFSNYGNMNNAQISCFDDFTMVYDVFGKVYELPVQVDETVYYSKTVTVDVQPGQAYETGYKFTYYHMQDGVEKSSSYYTMKNETQMRIEVVSGNADAVVFENVHEAGRNETGRITFTEGGTYEIDLYAGRGFVQHYVFNVAEAAPALPGYGIKGSYLGNEITVDVSRTVNDGNGINADFVVTVPDGDTVKTLQRGVDYEVYSEKYGERTLVEGTVFLKKVFVTPERFVIVFTDSANVTENTTVTLEAIDYDNAVLCATEKLESAFAAYSLTAEYKTGDYGNYIEYAAICPDDKAIQGLELRVELKLKIDGAEEWTVQEKISFGYLMSMLGVYLPTSGDEEFAFSAEGKYPTGETCCIVLEGVTSADVVFEINVYATNYGDALVATATNAQ